MVGEIKNTILKDLYSVLLLTTQAKQKSLDQKLVVLYLTIELLSA